MFNLFEVMWQQIWVVWRRTDLRHSSMREAMPWRLIMLTTQMRLMPQMAGSGVVEQHQALWRSNITFSPSEPSGTGSSITLYPCEGVHKAQYTSTNAVCCYLFLHNKTCEVFSQKSLTSCMCSAIRHPPTFLSLEMKRKVLVWEGHLDSTCWKPRSLSTISLISSTWETNSYCVAKR